MLRPQTTVECPAFYTFWCLCITSTECCFILVQLRCHWIDWFEQSTRRVPGVAGREME